MVVEGGHAEDADALAVEALGDLEHRDLTGGRGNDGRGQAR